ncbi:MAG: preprotein translocase subunit SecE [Candidatus Omnitrophota bacterium]|jgi:preprotein translocase subunit SecE
MFEKTGGFFRETKQELNKVTWPSRNELWQATVVVIFATLMMAAFIALVDFTISTIVRVLLR